MISLALVAGCCIAQAAHAANPNSAAGAPIGAGLPSPRAQEWTDANVLLIFNIFRSFPLDYCKTVMSEASARIQANPKDAVAYEVRGLARRRVEQFTGAIDDLKKANSLSPTARNGNVY